MAKVVQLKDSSQAQVFPVTKERAVYAEDGRPAINKPVATVTKIFPELATAAYRVVWVPLSLSEGYYTVHVSGILDQSVDNTLCYVQKAQNLNSADMVKLVFSNRQMKSTEYVYSFYLSDYQATYALYLAFGQQTTLGGTVTVDVYNAEQLHWNIDSLNEMIYKPLAQGGTFRAPLDSGTATWRNCYVPVNLTAGRYAIKTRVGSYNTDDVIVRFTKAKSLNVADLVKTIFNRGTIGRDRVFYVDVTQDEAELIQYLTMGQCITKHIDYTIEIFPIDQLYWDVDILKTEVGISLPSYYYNNNWLNTKIKRINDYSGFIHGISFPFITDLHFTANAQNSKYLLKHILKHTPCSMVICGGDIAPAYGNEDDLQSVYDTLLEYAGYIGHDKWFSVVGNHDFHINIGDSSSSTRLNWTWGKTYSGLIKPSERWQVRSEQAGGYYCVDNDVQKVRFVMLNTTEPVSGTSGAETPGSPNFTDAQLSWLTNVLIEHSGYNIIIVSHITTDPGMPSCPGFSRVQSCLEAFRNKRTYSNGGITANFTNTTNELVCHINGHCHSDDSHVSDNVLTISTTCDAWYADDGWGASRNSVTEQAFDVFCINFDSRTINATRIGRGNNRSWTY